MNTMGRYLDSSWKWCSTQSCRQLCWCVHSETPGPCQHWAAPLASWQPNAVVCIRLFGNRNVTSTATFTNQLWTGIDWQQQHEHPSSSKWFVLMAVQAKLTVGWCLGPLTCLKQSWPPFAQWKGCCHKPTETTKSKICTNSGCFWKESVLLRWVPSYVQTLLLHYVCAVYNGMCISSMHDHQLVSVHKWLPVIYNWTATLAWQRQTVLTLVLNCVLNCYFRYSESFTVKELNNKDLWMSTKVFLIK